MTAIEASEGFSDEELLELAAYAETHSSHPIANSIKERYGKKIDEHRIDEKMRFDLMFGDNHLAKIRFLHRLLVVSLLRYCWSLHLELNLQHPCTFSLLNQEGFHF